MTKLTILSSNEQFSFNNPSKLNHQKRERYFSLDHDVMDFIKTLRTPTNQVGFLLQLGYFRANGKFFIPQQFKSPDINFVIKKLNLCPKEVHLSEYVQGTSIFHRKKILESVTVKLVVAFLI